MRGKSASLKFEGFFFAPTSNCPDCIPCALSGHPFDNEYPGINYRSPCGVSGFVSCVGRFALQSCCLNVLEQKSPLAKATLDCFRDKLCRGLMRFRVAISTCHYLFSVGTRFSVVALVDSWTFSFAQSTNDKEHENTNTILPFVNKCHANTTRPMVRELQLGRRHSLANHVAMCIALLFHAKGCEDL